MPRYTYRCTSCEQVYEEIHRMSEKKTVCRYCDSESLEKIPSTINTRKTEPLKRVGSIVDSYIENTKKEIEAEKKKLRDREI
jgi:putative FmdB family regulatory protein